MKKERKIVVRISTSADGFIARPDGNVDWLNRHPRPDDHGMRAFYSSIDTVLWGRKTYDWAVEYFRKQGAKDASFFDPKFANFVFSHTLPKKVVPGAEFISEPVKTFARRLRAKPGKDIWIMGGGGIIASFLDAGEIDAFDIYVIPVFIGEGIPLVAPRHRDVPLRLLSARTYPDGAVRLRYDVAR